MVKKSKNNKKLIIKKDIIIKLLNKILLQVKKKYKAILLWILSFIMRINTKINKINKKIVIKIRKKYFRNLKNM